MVSAKAMPSTTTMRKPRSRRRATARISSAAKPKVPISETISIAVVMLAEPSRTYMSKGVSRITSDTAHTRCHRVREFATCRGDNVVIDAPLPPFSICILRARPTEIAVGTGLAGSL